jgi:glycosyltransferase involved in cell wall biosynthesis
MNVLVWSSWVAHPVGGTERISLELALGLHKRNHHVALIGAFDNAPELRAKIPPDMPYYFFDIHRRRPKPYLAAARLYARVIREHKIEIVSAHGTMFALHEICKRAKIPMIWTIHGAQPLPKGAFGRLKIAAVNRVFAHPGTHLVAVSAATAKILRANFPKLDKNRVHIIHNGAPDEADLLNLPLPKAGPPWNLGFVGRLAERKRPLDLVEVAQKLGDSLDFSLQVFGAGPLLGALRDKIQQKKLEKNFILHGYWDKGSAGMVKKFHILVHTDSTEPFGGALVEAQLGGRPVVAYNVGGNPEIVEHGVTGWLVPLGDTAALADGVRKIAGKNYANFSAAARNRATETFPVSKMVEKYESLFANLCAKR